MMRAIAREHDGGAWFVAPQSSDPELVRIDVEALTEWADDARRNDAPALVLGASFAFVHLLDGLGGSRALRLPPGSRAMQTGGFKGRSRTVAPDELRARVAEALGTPDSHVISEYGMTELSSQGWEPSLAHALGRYEGPVENHHHALPPWMRVDAVHPERFTPLPLGEEGLGRVIDLANIDSALVVQTADRVVVTEAGVRVLGRDPAAVERGCSLGMDELLSGSVPRVDGRAR
jgi:hypothetical protein